MSLVKTFNMGWRTSLLKIHQIEHGKDTYCGAVAKCTKGLLEGFSSHFDDFPAMQTSCSKHISVVHRIFWCRVDCGRGRHISLSCPIVLTCAI